MAGDEPQVPIRYRVADGLIRADLVEQAFAGTPPRDWPTWVRYANPFEWRKRTCRELAQLPECWRLLMAELHSDRLLNLLRQWFGVAVQADPVLHGAGCHVLDPGGRLTCHLDYSRHPTLPLERRLNLVLFLNPVWDEGWGGALEFWNEDATEVARRIYPAFGRAVVWESGEAAFHAVEELSCPKHVARVTAACYYLAEPRPWAVRRRALFVPQRGES